MNTNAQIIKAQNFFADTRERLVERAQDEQGDAFAALVLTIGLVVAAAAVGPELIRIVGDLVGDIETSAAGSA